MTGVEVGKDKMGSDLMKENDAMLLATGSTWPRDLPIPGMIELRSKPVSYGCLI